MLSDNGQSYVEDGSPKMFYNTLVGSFNHLNNNLQLKIYILKKNCTSSGLDGRNFHNSNLISYR